MPLTMKNRMLCHHRILFISVYQAILLEFLTKNGIYTFQNLDINLVFSSTTHLIRIHLFLKQSLDLGWNLVLDYKHNTQMCADLFSSILLSLVSYGMYYSLTVGD